MTWKNFLIAGFSNLMLFPSMGWANHTITMPLVGVYQNVPGTPDFYSNSFSGDRLGALNQNTCIRRLQNFVTSLNQDATLTRNARSQMGADVPENLARYRQTRELGAPTYPGYDGDLYDQYSPSFSDQPQVRRAVFQGGRMQVVQAQASEELMPAEPIIEGLIAGQGQVVTSSPQPEVYFIPLFEVPEGQSGSPLEVAQSAQLQRITIGVGTEHNSHDYLILHIPANSCSSLTEELFRQAIDQVLRDFAVDVAYTRHRDQATSGLQALEQSILDDEQGVEQQP